jgi:glycerol-3-phosphate dehydrogenase
VRYTTARAEADRAVRAVFRKLGRSAPPSPTASRAIHGGDIPHFDELESDALASRPEEVSDDALRALLRNHGSEYRRVLAQAASDPELLRSLPGSHTLRAEVIHAVREEMALHLGDVVFGRTDLGTMGHPGSEALEISTQLMAAELGWDASRCRKEIELVTAAFPDTPDQRVTAMPRQQDE